MKKLNMIKTLKYIGLAGVATILLFSLYVGYSLLDWLFNDREYYRGRFLLTATVEVDGEVKTGQSVYEVSYNARRGGGGFGSSPIKGMRGTMPFIDLGTKGTIVFSFERTASFNYKKYKSEIDKSKCLKATPIHLPTGIMVPKTKNYDFRDYVDDMIDVKGVISLEKYSLPIYFIPYKGRIQDAKPLDFCELSNYSHGKILPLDITIQHSKMVRQDQQKATPMWLSFWRLDYKNFLHDLKKLNENSTRPIRKAMPFPHPKIFERDTFSKQ